MVRFYGQEEMSEFYSRFDFYSYVIIDNIIIDVDREHKSSIGEASANLINAIVGAGIVGMPYAVKVIV